MALASASDERRRVAMLLLVAEDHSVSARSVHTAAGVSWPRSLLSSWLSCLFLATSTIFTWSIAAAQDFLYDGNTRQPSVLRINCPLFAPVGQAVLLGEQLLLFPN